MNVDIKGRVLLMLANYFHISLFSNGGCLTWKGHNLSNPIPAATVYLWMAIIFTLAGLA
jgi:hypothetical protein